MPKTTHIQHFSGELKFTAIECIIQEGSIIFIYNEPTQKLVEPFLIIKYLRRHVRVYVQGKLTILLGFDKNTLQQD